MLGRQVVCCNDKHTGRLVGGVLLLLVFCCCFVLLLLLFLVCL